MVNIQIASCLYLSCINKLHLGDFWILMCHIFALRNIILLMFRIFRWIVWFFSQRKLVSTKTQRIIKCSLFKSAAYILSPESPPSCLPSILNTSCDRKFISFQFAQHIPEQTWQLERALIFLFNMLKTDKWFISA
jgi:hypothetical protein